MSKPVTECNAVRGSFAFPRLFVIRAQNMIRHQDAKNSGLSSVDAPRAGPRGEQIQEDEAVENRKFSTVGNGPETSRCVAHKVGHSHFAAQKESHGPGKQSQDYEEASDELEHAGDPGQGQELGGGAAASHSSEQSQDLLKTVQRKSESNNYPQHRKRIGPPGIESCEVHGFSSQ
jgi:hypothetical protein